MRIGVVSDTHLPRFGRALPRALSEGLAGVDLILHAGDFVTELAVELLEAIAPVIGVAGNNDDAAIRARYPLARVEELAGKRVGLTHGHAGRGRTTPERALATFAEERVAAIVFGHSHIPLLERRDGVLLFNPGSPTDRRRQPRCSFGVIEIGEDGALHAHHVCFSR